MEYKAKPEYEKCVEISTKASIREMMLPGAIALITPIIVGFIFGPEVLGGLLAGVTVSGVLMGIFQNNAGGAWDNAKKSFEKGVEIDGEMYYKKSEPHKASVTGDTVGDPFKDTSGPSMNILIKLMSIVSLVIAPYIAVGSQDKMGDDCCAKEKTEVSACCSEGDHHTVASKCDLNACSKMTKEECAMMCDSMGCSAEEKAKCMSLYNEKGEYVGACMESCGKKCTSKEECMTNCGEACASKH
jgi:K(+)-stimulated pyrophosphate-energized sodium pump